MKSKHADLGKWAEGQVTDWLEPHSLADVNFAFHRLPDARSARSALASQPCDFMVVDYGEPTLLEVKESANPRRLPRDKISQYGKLKKFHWAGAKTIVLVFRSHFQDWYVFTGSDIFTDVEETPASFPFDPTRRTYSSAEEALERIFQ